MDEAKHSQKDSDTDTSDWESYHPEAFSHCCTQVFNTQHCQEHCKIKLLREVT